MHADIFGSHRVIAPRGVLPQAADRIDPDPVLFPNEILIDVTALQPTSTAFDRIRKECGDDIEKIKETILSIVRARGKFQDPVTRSGGILIGRIEKIGKDYHSCDPIAVGDKIATLVSLSLTPLTLEAILGIDMDTDQVRVQGKAILFQTGIWAHLPEDLPENLAMAVLDVAGAPAQVRVHVGPGQTVAVIGAGKAGLLCLAEAMDRVFPHGKVVCLEFDPETCRRVEALGLAHHVICADAQKPLDTWERYRAVMGENLADFTVNCVNVPHTEVGSVMITKDTGTVCFFSMNTDFSRAALGAEGIRKQTRMIIGNGYYPGHAQIAFQIIREHFPLRRYFEAKFV